MKIISKEILTNLLARAATEPRRRINLNLHEDINDPTNRFLNAGVAGTYIQPHRHRTGKWELLSVLQGRVDVLIFTAQGEVKSRVVLSDSHSSTIEIPGGEWHSFVFCAPGAVVLEVKPGPYEAKLDKEFADWAPSEGDAAVATFTPWLDQAVPGEIWRK